MPDTTRDEADLLTIFDDNASGQITPQDARDFIVSSRIDSVATHLTNTSNPHSVDETDVGNTTAQWNADQLQDNAVKDETPSVDGYVLTWNNGLSQWESQVNVAVAHIADTDNPHSVDETDVGNTTAQWNADQLQDNAVKDETLGAGQNGYVLTWNQSGPYWEAQENTQGVNVEEDDVSVLTDAATLNFGYGINVSDAGGSQADIVVDASVIDHDALNNFVANEHIDHSSVQIIAGDGLAGSGYITSDVTLSVDINGAGSAIVATGDEVLIADINDSNNIKKTTAGDIANLNAPTDWTESNSTYDSVEFAKWTPSSGSSNVAIVLQPKGNRGIQAQEADGLLPGGNNRGQYSVDLQMKRTLNSQVASGNFSVIFGGSYNTSSAAYCAVAGGHLNYGKSLYGFVGGGKNNWSGQNNTQKYATACGGLNNKAYASYSFVGGGQDNAISDSRTHSVICGGQSNTITAGTHGFIGGGKSNTVAAAYASVLGGVSCSASGAYSIAMGRRAKTGSNAGAFVFADSTDADFEPSAADTFCIRASGGLMLVDGNEAEGLVLTCDSTGVGTWQNGNKILTTALVSSSAWTAGTNDEVVIIADATTTDIDITLPTASGNEGRVFSVKKIDSSANTVTVDGDGFDIDGSATNVISTQYDAITIVANTSEWWII